MSTPLTILFAGSGAFGLPTLRALRDAGHTLAQIITQPDRPAGRGRQLTPTPIARYAVDHSLPLVRTDDVNTLTLPPADLLVVIAFGQKIAPHVVDHARLGAINLHASRLPAWRGAAPIARSVLAGDRTTGNSIIRLAEKMDAGAVLAMSELVIGDSETAGELHDRLADDGAPLMLATIDQFANGSVIETLQDASRATLARKLSRDDALIDWAAPPPKIVRQINGLSPWPGCRVRLIDGDGKERARLTLLRSAPVAGASDAPNPAQISADTIGGTVRILDVLPDGKRPMSLAAYRNGGGWKDGWTVESIR